MNGTAYFVRHPRTAADLIAPHLLKHERSYEVVKTIILSDIEYENFTSDMLADRQFIEDNASLCSSEEILHCILVRKNFCQSGVLVVPESTCYVGWAAYVNTNT